MLLHRTLAPCAPRFAGETQPRSFARSVARTDCQRSQRSRHFKGGRCAGCRLGGRLQTFRGTRGCAVMWIVGFIFRLALWLFLAPLLPGVINKVKAWIAGRRGPPILQLYYDLAKLWRKGVVVSTLASPGFIAGPAV